MALAGEEDARWPDGTVLVGLEEGIVGPVEGEAMEEDHSLILILLLERFETLTWNQSTSEQFNLPFLEIDQGLLLHQKPPLALNHFQMDQVDAFSICLHALSVR